MFWVAAIFFCLPVLSPLRATSFQTNAPMNFARRAHTATLLLDETVLVVAGQGTNDNFLASAELFDPETGAWQLTGLLAGTRAFHTATLLPNGKVLVVGGFNGNPTASAELYDPVSATWAAASSMNTARDNHTAILLPNGKVLVVGGLNVFRDSIAKAELYDPATDAWTDAGTMTAPRWGHTLTLMANGKVIVTGGIWSIAGLSNTLLSSAETYDPGAGTWSDSTPLNTGRYNHTANLLPNGKVMVAGGSDQFSPVTSSEIYDPNLATWTASGALNSSRSGSATSLLPDGKVLVVGGFSAGNAYLSSAELYNPTLGTWVTNGFMGDFRYQHTATLLANGNVLVTGGLKANAFNQQLASTDLYDSGSGATSTNGRLQVILSPAGAVAAGAQWQVDGGAFYDSGVVLTNLSGGTHVVSFTNVSGFGKPVDQLTTIVSRTRTNLVTAVYTPNPGAVQVFLNPSNAVAAGAQWQVDGGAFQTDGAVVTNLSVGTHTVAFKTISGWFTPGSQLVTVASDMTTNLTGNYTLTAGGLQVNLSPAGAVTNGALWQVDGGVFQTNGAVVGNLSEGNHLLSFQSISGWTTPSNQIVAVTAAATNVVVGNYGSLATGALRLTLAPVGAVAAGARWQVDGGSLLTNGAVVTGLPPGNHRVTFFPVPGFITPPDQTNAVASNVTNTFAGTYITGELTKPTLTLIAPVAGRRYSNSVFTATGAAKDNVRVVAVFYQFNSNDWATVSTGNNFTNWSVPNLTLTPGTNTFKVYAVDPSNNRTATNIVKFNYVLTDRLLVSLTGKGTLSPNYSNAVLEIGKNYAMTATAAAGYRFTNWTGSLTTNSAKLAFNMQSNLNFTANFVDSARPVNIVTNPVVNRRYSNQVFTAAGKASDNLRVSNVWYQLNNQPWTNALTSNNWTNWNAPDLVLTPGTNVFRSYAEDTTGNRSLTNTIKFIFVLTDRLIVQFVGGRGTLSPNYSNAVLEIGRNYATTATAATGFRFLNWSGSLATTNAKLAFTMQSNLNFTANFLDITRPANVIITPTANQKWSNAVFTASGRASDNVAVTGVWYRVNSGGWNPATLAGNKLDWSTPGLANFLPVGSNQIQAFAVDSVGNLSLTTLANFSYRVLPVTDWAPDSLNGLLASITQHHSGGTNTQFVGFDPVNFAQSGTDDDAENYGVGYYSYTKTGTNTASIVLNYTLPPTQSNETATVSFVFTNHYGGYFTNDNSELEGISFVIATNYLPGSIAGKTLIAASTGSTNLTSVKFSNAVNFTQTGGGASGAGQYTLTRFSPVGGMLVLTYTNVARLGQVTYVQTTFTNAANGNFYVHSFDSLGGLQDTNNGKFKLQ